MYNMIQNGFFTDGFCGWTVHGSLHDIKRMNTIRRPFTQIPVSSAISQMITVNRNSSYVLQFKINSNPRGMFCICVKEWITNSEGKISTGHVYEFDHYGSQRQFLTTGPYTDRLEITIENTGQSPLTLSSIEITPTQHNIFSETYSQQDSEPSYERDNSNPIKPPFVDSSFFLPAYLDLSAVKGLNSLQIIEHIQNNFAHLIRYIPKDPLQHVLRWMNSNGAIQVVPMDYDSSDPLVSFHEPEKRIIVKMQYTSDTDLTEFIENVLYGLGLALDVYAGNRASDHPEFQKCIQQEKERYREATGYVFSGDYHDIFAQIFTSLYSPYEEVRQKIIPAVPHTSHYVQRLFESFTPSVSQISKELNTFEGMDHFTTKLHMYENHPPYNTLRVGPEKPEEKPEEIYKKYSEVFQTDGYDFDNVEPKDRDILQKHIIEQSYDTLLKGNLHLQHELSMALNSHDSKNNMKVLNQMLFDSTGDTSTFPKNAKDLVQVLDEANQSQYAVLPHDAHLIATARIGDAWYKETLKGLSRGDIYGTLTENLGTIFTLPSNTSVNILDIFVPSGMKLLASPATGQMYLERNQVLRYLGTEPVNIDGAPKLKIKCELVDKERGQKQLEEQKEAAKYAGQSTFINEITKGPNGTMLLADGFKPLLDLSEISGTYAGALATTENTTEFVQSLLSGIPKNVLANCLNQIDPEGTGFIRLTDQHPTYWGDVPENATLLKNTKGVTIGYYDPIKKQIKVYFGTNSISTNKLAGVVNNLLWGPMNETLRYTAPDAQQQDGSYIKTFTNSPIATEIYARERERYKMLNSNMPAQNIDEFYAAIFAALNTLESNPDGTFTDSKERQRVLQEAPEASRLLQEAQDKANQVLDVYSTNEEWRAFAKEIKDSVQIDDYFEKLFIENQLPIKIQGIQDFLRYNISLTEEQKEILRGLEERIKNLDPIPRNLILTHSESPDNQFLGNLQNIASADAFDDSALKLDMTLNTQVLSHGDSDGEPVYLTADQTTVSLVNAANASIPPKSYVMINPALSNTGLFPLNAAGTQYATVAMFPSDYIEVTQTPLPTNGEVVTVKTRTDRIQFEIIRKLQKFNNNVLNSTKLIRPKLLDISRLPAEKALDAIERSKTIFKANSDKLPEHLSTQIFDYLRAYPIMLTDQEADEKNGYYMPAGTRSIYDVQQNLFVVQISRTAIKVPDILSFITRKDFRNDVLFSKGMFLYPYTDKAIQDAYGIGSQEAEQFSFKKLLTDIGFNFDDPNRSEINEQIAKNMGVNTYNSAGATPSGVFLDGMFNAIQQAQKRFPGLPISTSNLTIDPLPKTSLIFKDPMYAFAFFASFKYSKDKERQDILKKAFPKIDEWMDTWVPRIQLPKMIL